MSHEDGIWPWYLEQNKIEQNRIFQLEWTFKDHVFQLPDHFGVNKKSNHINESIVQMSLEH